MIECHPIILFLCPHNAAKGVIAAAYCERLAAGRGLRLRAASAGTEPDPGVSSPVVAALRAEGIDVSGHRPRRVTGEEVGTAWHVVSIGYDLENLAPPSGRLERWDDIPSPNQDMAGARDAIRIRIIQLLDQVAAATGPAGAAVGIPCPPRPGGRP